MTVSYQYDVASSSTGGFFRLLWRWRGSIWKLLYKELLLFLAVYISIAFTYDFLMTDYYKKYYEHIVVFCSAFVEVIPLSFILGFYVSFTATRWWQQYTAIPWPDKLMNIIALYIPGNDVTSRVLRRTLMRYLNLTLVLVLRSISIPVKRRFPTKEHLVEAGFMSRPELEIYQSVPSHEFNTFWIPCTWFVNLLREAKSECRITDSGGIKLIMEEFNEFRSKCGLLWSYDWVSIPLVYTQVVTLSTQAFFLASLLGRQHINSKPHIYGEYYIPVFTMLQFILYMGLLKLGEQLINPFGDDDEDFELNWIIDRHLKVSFLGVDILNSDPPPLIKDNYFDDMDIKLPYTEAAVAHKVKTYRGSVAAFHVPTDKHGLVIPEFEDDNNDDSDDEPSTIQSNRDAFVRNNSWSLFNQRKRKLSSSFDSFNSELMVETGLSESEMPELVPTNSSWPTFLRFEQQQQQQQKLYQQKQQQQQQQKFDDNKFITTTTSLPPTTSSIASLSSKLSVWPINNNNNNNDNSNNNRQEQQQKANEDTQGIRWSDNGPKNEENNNDDSKNQQTQKSKIQQQQQQQQNEREKPLLYKQSSFSTSDSSIVIPMDETTNQWINTNTTSRIYRPSRLPLQVFSKEMANAPLSVFNQILESNLRRKNSSLSSLSLTKTSPIILNEQQQRQQQKLYKPPYKSLIKSSTRQTDSKLRIRPFRSKVTFSDDTKNYDNTLQIRRGGGVGIGGGFNYQYDSSSESNSSLMRIQQQQQQQQQDISQQYQQQQQQQYQHNRLLSPSPLPSSLSNVSSTLTMKKMSDTLSFNDNCKRRQSMDPTIYQRDKPIFNIDEKQQEDNWLHYQSLPNIQEEEQQQQQHQQQQSQQQQINNLLTLNDAIISTTNQQQSNQKQKQQQQLLEPKKILPPNIIIASTSSSSSSPSTSSPSASTASTSTIKKPPPLIMTKQMSSLDTNTSSSSISIDPKRKKNFKRQKSQEITDDDLIQRLSTTTTTTTSTPTTTNTITDKMLIKKQSSSDSQGSNNSSTTNKILPPPPGILKKQKDEKTLKQASTESDTGSYHTVRSLILNPSSSSIDSFTSAISTNSNLLLNNNNNNNQNINEIKNEETIIKNENNDTATTTTTSTNLTENRLLSFTTIIESSLVPKIIFSQSTPSVTSQSSDDHDNNNDNDNDNNSPKWDNNNNFSEEFSSMETIIHSNILPIDKNNDNNDNDKCDTNQSSSSS